MFRLLSFLVILGSFGTGGWFAYDKVPAFQEFVEEKVGLQRFSTLEIHYSADEIMTKATSDLLRSTNYSFLEPTLIYYPYLLMHVKYTRTPSSQTSEGVMLFGLSDGEMVLDASTWERTHGFEDCLLAKATKNDFKVMHALVRAGGSMDREKLYRTFHVDNDLVDDWVDSCRKKKLIAISGNQFRLHFQNPKFSLEPTTCQEELIVTSPSKHSSKVKRTYSTSQIHKLCETLFGNDFAVRKTEEVFLPVYELCVQNPDGSVHTSRWNALTGSRFEALSIK